MKTFTNLDVEYLIEVVQSKFAEESDRITEGNLYGRMPIPNLAFVETEVVRVIREWAEPNPATVESVRKMYPVKGES